MGEPGVDKETTVGALLPRAPSLTLFEHLASPSSSGLHPGSPELGTLDQALLLAPQAPLGLEHELLDTAMTFWIFRAAR